MGFLFFELSNYKKTIEIRFHKKMIAVCTDKRRNILCKRLLTIDSEDKKDAVKQMEQFIRDNDNELTKVVRNGSLKLIRGGL
jgi:hypothetical protein